MMANIFDVAIIGGGINGCGCAADAALRGLSVVLFEQDDLAGKTSSCSTKLIHGGLRYLEYFEFGLVKKALDERQVLLNNAPHLVHPLALVLPYQKHMRPAWLLRLGLFLYDHLSHKNKLPKCESITSTKTPDLFSPLDGAVNNAFLFYDGATDDARLTISNALQAQQHGASIRPYERVVHTEPSAQGWKLTIKPQHGATYQIHAKSLINATGPWIGETAPLTHISLDHTLSLVKGSHIVVPKLYEGSQAYFLQHEDKRVVFVIPYHGHSMIGTTDIPFTGLLQSTQITQQEIKYLITLVNSYFKTKVHAGDIVQSWSGVRPLLAAKDKSASALSRDYHYQLDLTPAPIVTILGGKITTYRQLSEDVVNQLQQVFPKLGPSVTKDTILPGSSWNSMSFIDYERYAKTKYAWLNADLLNRYLFSYGSNTELFLSSCTDLNTLGTHYGSSLYQVELDYLIEKEWARNLDDILLRRTKLGLVMNEDDKRAIQAYLHESLLSEKSVVT
jgi:glycerol-3-phosphate dehydrogenase